MHTYLRAFLSKSNFFAIAIILISGCLMGVKGLGQTTVIVGGGASVTCPSTPTATWTTPPAGVTFSNWSRGVGVTCGSANNGLSGSGFNTTNANASYSANKYYSVTITTDATHSFVLSSIVWTTAISSGTGIFDVQYSNNGSAVTTFGATGTNSSSNAFTGSVTVAPSTSIVLYLMPSGTGASGTTVRWLNGSSITLTASTVSCTNPNITAHPSLTNQTYCQNSTATALTVAANGTSITYQWFSNTSASNSGGTLISGATSSSYTPLTTAAGTTYYYAVVYSGTCSTSSNVSGSITVTALPANPSGTISGTTPACTSTSLSFSGTAPTGTNYYWQTVSSGTSTASNASTSLAVSSSGNYYVTAYNGTCWSSGQAGPYTVTVNSPPIVTQDPSNASVAVGSTATFSVTTTNAAGYQWQVSTDGGATFTNTSTGTGSTTANYTTPSTTTGMAGYQYRCVVTASSPCVNVTSAAATLSIVTGSYIWTNPITGTNPNTASPYTTGQLVAVNISVSGISRSSSIAGANANDRYNASNWNASVSIDLMKYFEFTLTPNLGYTINFTSFIYTGQMSSTGPALFAIRSSVDGYAANIGTASATGTTISLTAAAYQTITSAITFRFYAWNASAGTGTYSINDFTFNGNVVTSCAATKLAFASTIANISQDAVIPTFSVYVECSDNTHITSCSSGTITLTTSGCGLKGTLTQPVVNGTATFSNISFDRSTQSSITITAAATGSCAAYTPATSTYFNVTTPGATATPTSIISENFEGSTIWNYTIGTPVVVGSGGTNGTDVTGVKTYGTNKAMIKSYSADNSAGEQGTINTVTFANQTGLGVYSKVDFSFQIGCLGVPNISTGAGADNGEAITIVTSIDGGSSWDTLLTNNGNSNHLFALSSASPVNLAYGANAKYSNGNSLWNQSAFNVTLPPGVTQFMFKMIAGDNRTYELYALDNLLLTGTNYTAGQQQPLPSSTGYSLNSCPGSTNTISIGTQNTSGTVTYNWAPAANISSTTDPTPNVYPATTTTYVGTATDADKCVTSSSVVVTVPSGAAGTWTGAASKDYFNCLNWGNGVIPASTTDVPITNTTNSIEIDATSPFAAAFANTASVKNLSVTNNSISFITGNEYLDINGNLSLNSGSVLNMINGGTTSLTGDWISSTGNFTSGSGKIIFDGASQLITTAANETFAKLTTAGSGIKTLTNNVTIADSLALNAGSLLINSNNMLTLSGAVTHFSGGITGSLTTDLTLNNAAVKHLYFTTANYVMRNVNLSASATNVYLDDSLYITAGAAANTFGTLTANGFLTTSGYLTLKSNQYGDAIVGQSAGTIGGNVTVERYIPARRAWRFLGIPFSSSGQTINSAWQEGNVSTQACPTNNVGVPGFGTSITYNNNTAIGFDVHNNNYKTSIQTYQNGWITPNGTYGNLVTTTTSLFPAYALFVRGDRTVCLSYQAPAKITTLRATGILNQVGGAAINSNLVAGSTGNFVLIGNPYASPIKLNNVLPGSSGVDKTKFWTWNPNAGGSGGVGGYVTFSLSGSMYVPNDGVTTASIQSGQAFMVQRTTSGMANLKFQETDKAVIETLVNVFDVQATPVQTISKVYVNLTDTSNAIMDGVGAGFNNQYSGSVDSIDVTKRWNEEIENMALIRHDTALAIEFRPVPTASDTLFFRLYLRQHPYRLKVFSNSLTQGFPAKAWIVDKYLGTETEINLRDTSIYNFKPNSDTNSYRNRFALVFKPLNNKWDKLDSLITKIRSHIYPNPVTGRVFRLVLENAREDQYTVNIFTMTGTLAAARSISHKTGTCTYSITLPAALTNGSYSVQVLNSKGVIVSVLSLIISK